MDNLQSSRQSIMRVNRQREPSTTRSRRPPLSCAPCRRRKVKCDRRQPCNQCISHNMADLCYYQDKERSRVSSHLPPRPVSHISNSPLSQSKPLTAATNSDSGRKVTMSPDCVASGSADSRTRTIQSLTHSSFRGSSGVTANVLTVFPTSRHT